MLEHAIFVESFMTNAQQVTVFDGITCLLLFCLLPIIALGWHIFIGNCTKSFTVLLLAIWIMSVVSLKCKIVILLLLLGILYETALYLNNMYSRWLKRFNNMIFWHNINGLLFELYRLYEQQRHRFNMMSSYFNSLGLLTSRLVIRFVNSTSKFILHLDRLTKAIYDSYRYIINILQTTRLRGYNTTIAVITTLLVILWVLTLLLSVIAILTIL